MASSKTPISLLIKSLNLISSHKLQPKQNWQGGSISWNKIIKNTCYFSSSVGASDVEDDKLHDDIKVAEKHTALHSALSELAGDYDGEATMFLQRFFRTRVKPVVSTGSLKLDLTLGIGGLPKGRIVEIYGQEASGKTTLALNVIREAQKVGGYCAYLDVENALDPVLLKMVAALIPQREIMGVINDDYVETQSRIMTQALRRIQFSLCRSDTLIIFINQVRSNVKAREGLKNVNEMTCGGNALPFYSAVRLRIARKGLLKTHEKVTGLGICIEVIKNKLAPAMKKADLQIEFGRGISRASEVLELASEHGVVLKEGNCYFMNGEVFNSKMEAETYLIQNESVSENLVKSLRRRLFRIDEDSES